MQRDEQFDVFVSHAWEDKQRFVRPLVRALAQRGLRVWYDELSLDIGDSLRESIDRGLAQSRFGVVVLSSAFFAKNWPARELDGLIQKALGQGRKVVLPVWHNVSRNQVAEYSLPLADLFAANSADGIEAVADAVKRVVDGSTDGPTCAVTSGDGVAQRPLASQADRAAEVAGRSAVDSPSSAFRDIVVRKFQAVPADDRPRPAPSDDEGLPPWALPDPRFRHITAWHVRLRLGTTYHLRWDFAASDAWVETEFVLFQHVKGDDRGIFDHYQRMASAGAFATDKWSESISPMAESWLVACYGKRRVGWDAPWYEMAPHTWAADEPTRSLELRFARTGEGEPAAVPATETREPTIWIEASATADSRRTS